MDARRTLTIGGSAAGAVGLAVAGSILVSHAVALTDAVGVPVSVSPVVVSAPATDTVRDAQPRTSGERTTRATFVRAPEPRNVAADDQPAAQQAESAQDAAQGTADAKEEKATTPTRASVRRVVQQYRADGDWSKVEKWIAAQSGDRRAVAKWRAFFAKLTDRRDGGAQLHETGTRAQAARHAEEKSGHSVAGSKMGQSRVSPDWRD
ncbi:MAG: hypothetical protein QM611_10100 [Microbacterium sp.]|uniref:hypothetical protein n=1 Tax=Microbacterium sp. TaxID=51671 RepID=UPI0039E62C7C